MTRAIIGVIAITAGGIIAGLGVVAGLSADFKDRATLTVIIVLAVLVVSGILIALVGRVLGSRREALRTSQTSTTRTSSSPTGLLR